MFEKYAKNKLDICNTSTFEQVFWKTKTFFKKLEYRFLTVKALRLKALAFQKPIILIPTGISEANLRQIEWWVQNGASTKNGRLPVTTLLFRKFCFSLRTSYKELIWCTNDPYAHMSYFLLALESSCNLVNLPRTMFIIDNCLNSFPY